MPWKWDLKIRFSSTKQESCCLECYSLAQCSLRELEIQSSFRQELVPCSRTLWNTSHWEHTQSKPPCNQKGLCNSKNTVRPIHFIRGFSVDLSESFRPVASEPKFLTETKPLIFFKKAHKPARSSLAQALLK